MYYTIRLTLSFTENKGGLEWLDPVGGEAESRTLIEENSHVSGL